MSELTLRISEIFFSLQGETKTIGLPTAFVRLTGCPLRCSYCDTEYAFQGGELKTLGEILAELATWRVRYITVTGGEPLAQPNCKALLTVLCDAGYEVSLETSGALSIGGIDERVSVVMDVKTPASNESHRNLYRNLDLIQAKDQLKFVVCSRADYEWARFKIDEYKLLEKTEEILFSPSFGQLSATELADWIVADQLPVRFQLQLHKILWNDEPGR